MRTTGGEQRVDVVYRRIDDEFLDPLHFRPDSLVGCPGHAQRRPRRPGHHRQRRRQRRRRRQARLHLRPRAGPLLPRRGAAAPQRRHLPLRGPRPARPRCSTGSTQLVLKPVDGSGGKGLVIGPQASDEELAALRARLEADPRGWIAQRVIQLSTRPTKIGERLAPRHVDLRPFAVNDGEQVWVLPGGLTRVALPEGSLVVNSSQGGGSKDTWVLARDEVAGRGRAPATTRCCPPRPPPAPGCSTSATPSSPTSSSSSSSRGAHRAEPGRRVALLAGPLRRARRGHRPPARRARAHAARGPVGRRGAACHDLLGVMGVPVPEGRVDARRTVQLLGFAPGSTSSIVGAIGGARENARGVREAISSELWESLNATYHSLRAQEADAAPARPVRLLPLRPRAQRASSPGPSTAPCRATTAGASSCSAARSSAST